MPPGRSPLRAPELHRWELVGGIVLGEDDRPDFSAEVESIRDPRSALAEVLTEALRRSPCVVSFSGGRDSSTVLAAAVDTARREGLPPPVPVTLRFPGFASSEESHWQELVISHLGLTDWEQITVESEFSFVGPVAQAALRRHGLMYPANTYFHAPILERARGGCVLTGFDGDGVFGFWRWAHVQSVLHGRVRPRPRDVLRVGLALAPPRVRRRWMDPVLLRVVPWIRPHALGEYRALVEADVSREPRRWDRRLSFYWRRRHLTVPLQSLDLLAADHGSEFCHPFLAPAFLAALARDGGPAGYGDRTRAMEVLFGDLLPTEIVTRRSKADFGPALWRGAAREFALTWDGSGVETELVDPDRLREVWATPSPFFGSATLLQQAWLAAQPK